MTDTSLSAATVPAFRLDFAHLPPLTRAIANLASPLIEWTLAFPELNDARARTASFDPSEPFAERALRALRVSIDVEAASLERIPSAGPVVVVVNHPFGGLDGLALLALLKRRRPDVKVLANRLLAHVPEMRDDCLFVDPFGGAGSARRNTAPIRAALRWVRGGGALAVFPAGEVSSLSLRRGDVADIGWSASVAGLIRASGANVLPMFFSGRNSDAFQVAGLISPRLRTLMLPRELMRSRGTCVRVQVGNVISASQVAQYHSDDELAAYLRVRTYLLAGREHRVVARPQASLPTPRALTEIAEPEDVVAIAREVESLAPDRSLAKSGGLRVYYARADEIPRTLREVGRLREITFRAVGEGSGKPRDLDGFDESYLHLFVWDESMHQVVGAYRLGLTDRILAASGKDGLYTHTLFHLRDELLFRIGPAIELGRSFVRAEYQKEFAPLMLLWKGIARFVAREPRYKMLFGPVSISNDYRSLTRQLLIEFLKVHAAGDDELHALVSPRNPPPARFGPGRNWKVKLAGTIVRTIEGIDELVGEIESDRASMPVLLRQYLKLNAKLLGFNIDPDFGDALDGLMLVDLTTVERAILARYMGRENADAFLQFHQKP
jgi:putative hemolysin